MIDMVPSSSSYLFSVRVVLSPSLGAIDEAALENYPVVRTVSFKLYKTVTTILASFAYIQTHWSLSPNPTCKFPLHSSHGIIINHIHGMGTKCSVSLEVFRIPRKAATFHIYQKRATSC